MKDRRENQLSMFRTFIVMCEKFIAIINGIQALASVYTYFKNLVTELDDTSKQQETDISGVTKNKKSLKMIMTEKASVIAGMIRSFANATNNFELLSEAYYPVSELGKMRDERSREKCQLIYDRALLYFVDLQIYGLDNLKLSSLQTAILNFNSKSQQPTVARAAKKQLTEKIEELSTQCLDLLKEQIDPMLLQVKESDPDAHKQLMNARQIIDLGVRHKKIIPPVTSDKLASISGTVKDSKGNLLKGVTCVLIAGDKSYTDVTDKKGLYVFGAVPDGSYSLQVILFGKKMIMVKDMTVKTNEIVEKDFKMEDDAGAELAKILK